MYVDIATILKQYKKINRFKKSNKEPMNILAKYKHPTYFVKVTEVCLKN